QAEDGIRDLIVTGVQTCALPICAYPNRRPRPARSPRRLHLYVESRFESRSPAAAPRHPATYFRNGETRAVSHPATRACHAHGIRSEERRVGKECRIRRGPVHATE